MTDAKHKTGFSKPGAYIPDRLIMEKDYLSSAPITCTHVVVVYFHSLTTWNVFN